MVFNWLSLRNSKEKPLNFKVVLQMLIALCKVLAVDLNSD